MKKFLPSALLAFGIWLLDLPLLAISPQSGDAAEQLMKALNGGILHPPGFPLQGWLNRLFVLLPFPFPTTGLAFLNSLGHATACFFLAESLRFFGVSHWARLLGVGAFAFFPAVWFNSVRPEVFAWSNAFIACALFLCVRFRTSEATSTEQLQWRAVILGCVVALSGSQHTLNVVALPLFLVSAYTLLLPKTTRASVAGLGLGSFAVLFAALYCSLFWMKTGTPLDWGEWNSLSDVVRHALRQEYGVFSFARLREAASVNGLGLLVRDLWNSWFLLLGLLPPGVLFLLRRGPDRALLLGVGGTVFLSAWVLAQTGAYGTDNVGDAVVSRFQGPLVVIFAFFLGLGFAQLETETARLLWVGRALATLAVCFVAFECFRYWSYANAGTVISAELFRRGIADQLPNDAFYISSSDLEAFYGVPTEKGVRFPIENGMVGLPWYANRMAQYDTRLKAVGQLSSVSEIVDRAYEQGFQIASTEVRLLWDKNRVPELRGLIFVLDKTTKENFTTRTVDAAVRLCALTQQLRALPRTFDPLEKNMHAHFARAYFGAASALNAEGKKELAQIAAWISQELRAGTNALAWTEGCRRLVAALPPTKEASAQEQSAESKNSR